MDRVEYGMLVPPAAEEVPEVPEILFRDEDAEMLVETNRLDEVMEEVVVVDGTTQGVRVEILAIIGLQFNAIIAANMDTILLSVQRLEVLAVAVLPKMSTKDLRKERREVVTMEPEEDSEKETDKATSGLVFWA